MKRFAAMGAVAVAVVVVSVMAWWVPGRIQEDECGYRLRHIGMAIANYKGTYGRYPSPNAGGHSWRIHIVPFQFASPLYDLYELDEPWNSESNRTLNTRPLPVKDGGPDRPHGMPFTYRCSATPEASSMTAFLMFVGEDAFGKPGDYRELQEITDPLDCTLVVGETIATTVHWLEPKDFDVDTMSFVVNDPNRLSVSSPHRRGPAVLFADGEVYRLSPDIDSETLRAMITINGGETCDRAELIERGLLRSY